MEYLKKLIPRKKKLKIELPHDPAVSLLDIYPKKTKTLIQKYICIPMFTAALLTITQIWKQPKRPSMDKDVVIYNTHTHNGTLLSH